MYHTTYIGKIHFKTRERNPRPLHRLITAALYYCIFLTFIVIDTESLKKRKRKTRPCKPNVNLETLKLSILGGLSCHKQFGPLHHASLLFLVV